MEGMGIQLKERSQSMAEPYKEKVLWNESIVKKRPSKLCEEN